LLNPGKTKIMEKDAITSIKQELPDREIDLEMVSKAKAGDLEAFEALVSRYERQVYTLALRIVRQEQDAEDVTQQTFISALENLAGFRGDSSFATWLMRIATYGALKILRKKRGLDTVSLEQETEPQEGYDGIAHPQFIADWRQTPDQLAQQTEISNLIEDALNRLDEKHRLVFLLRDVEGLSIQETAESLKLSESNVKVRLLRARLQLRESLTQALGDPQTQIHRSHHAHS